MNGQIYDPNLPLVRQMLQQGEGQTIEFKEGIPTYLSLAQQISAFANAEGGSILIGVRDHPVPVAGINYADLTPIFDRAIANLVPAGGVTLDEVNVDGRHIGLIRVNQYRPLMNTKAGVYIREGESVRAMTPHEIVARLAPPAAAVPINVDAIAQAIATNTQTISDLSEDIAYSQSIRGQWKTILISCAISFPLGIITGFLGNLLTMALIKGQ